ncbi:MAG: HAD hydrolase-like protein [Candidatus Woesearchaeota archaeon]
MKSLQANKVVVFDLDGVIIDSLIAFWKVENCLFKKLGRKGITLLEYQKAFLNNPWQSLFKMGKFDKKEQKQLIQMTGPFTKKHYKKVKLHSGIKKVIIKLAKSHKLVIISSTPEKSIDFVLKKYKIRKYFKKFYGAEAGIKKIVKFRKCQRDFGKNLIFITDSVGDIKEAKQMKIPTIGVGWGYQPSSWIKKAKPTYFAKNSEKIIKILSG